MASARQNTPGLGIEYEVHLPAYFALLLNSNPEIEDFKLRSNVEEFGNLDDLLVDIKTKSGKNLYFAFQLKHKENFNKNLLPTNFEARGDFNLEKYCEAFKKLSKENRKYNFILYTNKNFDSSRTNEVKKFDMRHDGSCLGRNFFDTSGDGKHLYKFEVNEETEDGKNVNREDYREFFSRFSLYTGQANIRDLDKSHILDILKYRECYVTYIDFFRRWHRGDFIDKILDKKTLNVHLVDILLSSVAINYHLSDGQVGNSNFFEAMVQQFDITIIDASKQDFINQLEESVLKYPQEFNNLNELIKLGKKSKLIDRFTKELNEKTKHKLLHYFFHKPLILDFHKSSEDVIYEASKLCKIQENQIKLVILGQDIDISKLSHLKIFTNLTEVHRSFLEEAKRRCNLYLQGRNFLFEEIFEDGIRQFVTPKDLFQMLKGTFSIGEARENLPKFYIPRNVSTVLFNIKSVIRHSSSSSVVIFYCKNEFENLKILIERILSRKDHFYEYSLDQSDQTTIILRKKDNFRMQLQGGFQNNYLMLPTVIVRKTEYSKEQLNAFLKELRSEDVRLFKVIDGERCLLLTSTKSIITLNENYKYTKMSVEENNIHDFFNNDINILCAQPGMGKSTLMKYLKNTCDPSFWRLKVDLKAHNQFLKRNHEIEEVLNYFLELENSEDLLLLNIKKLFLRRKKIVLFLDGLDEVVNECVNRVLTITRQLSEMGFRIWLSSRQNLQQKVEQYFNIFAIEMNELNEDQQKKYIEKRLTSLYSKQEIEEIVEKIFNNADLANNRHILEIPLQLYIITQIFLDDKSYYSKLSESNYFILTKMFEIFFEGKYNHYVTKLGLKSPHLLGELEEQLENYELVALHSVLDDDHFQKLQIENFNLSRIKKSDFRLGIITEVNRENKAVFEHLTFAEYFASKFLVKNFDKACILKEEIFAEKYPNLRIMFNIMLTEDSPYHLAIFYKDLDRIRDVGQSSLVDKGGRNLLQVAACIATRHPRLESNPNILFRFNNWLVNRLAPAELSECLVKDESVHQFKGEDSKIKEIVNLVLPISEPLKIDKIFGWNSLEYALVNGALYMVEAILGSSEKPFHFYEILGKHYSDEVVAYYSVRFGYHRLLSEIIAKNSCHVTGILRDYPLGHKSILNFLFVESDCTNRTKIAELLVGDDINRIVYEESGYTLLHFAVFHNDIKFIKFLLGKRVDANVKDDMGMGQSPLFNSIIHNKFEISKLLVENGADVNMRDQNGWPPLFHSNYQNNFNISKLLLENGAHVNTKYEDGRPPLFWTIDLLTFEISKLLIEKGADVNIKDKNGRSPLIWALKLTSRNRNRYSSLGRGPRIDADKFNLKISKLLIEKGADLNIQDREDGKTPLFVAFENNEFELAMYLLKKGADLNIKDYEGRTILLLAIERNNFNFSKLLVEKGADVNIKDKNGWSPLFFAVSQNNSKIAKLLLENGADVKIIDKRTGRSPFFSAVCWNNSEIAKLLVEKGADVNVKDKEDGKTPLHWAAKQNNLEISELLLEKGANPNVRAVSYEENGRTPLFWAVSEDNFQISKLLVEKGADVNIRDKAAGRTPLFSAISNDNFEISKLLLEKGADVNVRDKKGKSPLIFAVKRNNLQISKLLLEKGADVNVRDQKGKSPLIFAVKRNNLQISKLLVEKGADVDVRDKKRGRTPLFWAAEQNNLEISKWLIGKGANVNIKDKEYGRSPLLAVRSRTVLKLLVEKGADVNVRDKENGRTLLFCAVYRDDLEISRLLVEKGADVNIKDKESGKTPLFLAIKQNNNFEISKLLVENGSNVNVRDKEDGRTSIFWAIERNNFDILKLLVEKGADINIRDRERGWSPLFFAVTQNKSKMSKFLLEKGANVNIDDNMNFQTPLFWAVYRDNFEISKLLVEKGADVNIEDEHGRSPLSLAVQQNNSRISKFLFENGAKVDDFIRDKYNSLVVEW